MILLTRWLFDLGAARVFLTIVAGNEDSVAVAFRAGFVYEGTMRAHGVWQGQRCDVMLFAALPLEWAMRRPDEETRHGVALPAIWGTLVWRSAVSVSIDTLILSVYTDRHGHRETERESLVG